MKLKIQAITEDKKSISGNTKFIKKNIIPMLKGVGVTNTRVRRFGDQIEIEFDADNKQFKMFQKSLQKKVGKEGSRARENFNIQIFENLIKEMIKEELLNERSIIDREYDQWHDASYALNKAIRNTKDSKLMKTFAKAWDNADTALLKWIEKNDPDYS